MQSAFQNLGVDNAVSKTINMPMNAAPEDVIKSYLLAYKERCKGVTIYRDRSRKKQILERGTRAEAEVTLYLRRLPVVRRGGTWGIDTPVGTLHATINEDEEGRPLETFFNVGKAGGDILAMAEAIGRLISLDLRTTNPDLAIQKLKLIIEQLSRIGGSISIGFGPHKILSLPDGIAKALQNYLDAKEGTTELRNNNNPGNKVSYGDICPKCGNATLIHEEGCNKCICGYSTC
jgi:ribonucleoside-diphosphate reductase alpha chain